MFVGSSSEARGLIRGLSLNLGKEVAVRKWTTIAWPLSHHTLDGIDQQLGDADFATFILAADDIGIIRGREAKIPRDNVVLELGMSLGVLGRDRTFILTPVGTAMDVRKPSDLNGITVVEYEWENDDRTTMSGPADQLLEAIEQRGRRDHASANGALERGDTAYIETIADGALHVNESRDEYEQKLRDAMAKEQRVPAKFQFALPDGGHYWLKLCRGTKYRYFERAKRHLQMNAARLAKKIHETSGSAAVDMVSLGCGDGTKDDIVLRALAGELTRGEYIYYYPIDISDILLVEAVRHIAKNGLNRRYFRCKPILGDFTNLASLKGIVAHRKNTNMFSVLGNAIGSFDESSIFASIQGAMEPGDFVLIEANTGEPRDSIPLLEEDAADQWDWSTLDALGIPRDECKLSQEPRADVSMVDGTRTLVSYAKHQKGKETRKYMLSAMHHYDLAHLKDHVETQLRVTLIDEIPGDGVCLLLGRRAER